MFHVEQLNSLIINNLQRVFQVKIEVINSMKKQYFLKQYLYSIITILIILILSFIKPSSPNSNYLFNIPHLDKLIHFLMYFGLTSILLVENKNRQKIKITISTIVLSGLIELTQQHLTNYRSGDWFDLITNSIGSTLSLIILMLYYNKILEIKILKFFINLK